MTNKDLQDFLAKYPDDMPVRLLPDHSPGRGHRGSIIEFDTENILHTSESAYVDEKAPEDEWDCEDGKIELGNGIQFLLINPIIL